MHNRKVGIRRSEMLRLERKKEAKKWGKNTNQDLGFELFDWYRTECAKIAGKGTATHC